ncbi:hypothetical protein F511_14895 [Dorcoceras hygrometricum]|uniref:Uncharacterized protein n=1 Tax=Dorcoceras hygrometricum TaxID=472368 RepID=A0A2Z7BRL8_9LAMI|nr:hypothetical protein F511_14895 [Dorcoceras hygrometricum]
MQMLCMRHRIKTEISTLKGAKELKHSSKNHQQRIVAMGCVHNVQGDESAVSPLALASCTSNDWNSNNNCPPTKPVDTIDLPNQQVYYNSQTQEPTAGFSNNATTIAKQTNGWFSKWRRANLLKRRRIGYAILTTSSWVTSRKNTTTHNTSLCWYQSQATVVKISRSWTSSRNKKTMTFPLRATGKLTRVDICFCWKTSRYTHDSTSWYQTQHRNYVARNNLNVVVLALNANTLIHQLISIRATRLHANDGVSYPAPPKHASTGFTTDQLLAQEPAFTQKYQNHENFQNRSKYGSRPENATQTSKQRF